MKKILFIIFMVLFLIPAFAKARDVMNITDWYIQDFQSDIVVNKDSSLSITENITADCGNLPDKHGIFRVLPTQTLSTTAETIKTPIKLVSITDLNGNHLPYSTINNYSDHTITWKIGDANKTVYGVNHYVIKYNVKNAVRFNNGNFDEFYWNINGNFWDIETDKYSATISLPNEVDQSNSKVNLYSGSFATSSNKLADYIWTADHTLSVTSNQMLKKREGITISVTFPKNIFTPYTPTFQEKYGFYFWLLIPLIAFALCFSYWYSNGRDPKINSAIAPMFEIPENLDPLTMGMIMSSGALKTQYITATVIGLAVKGYLTIEEIKKDSVFSKQDYVFILKKNDFKLLSFSELKVVNSLFSILSINESVRLSSLENVYYADISTMKNEIYDYLIKHGVFVPSAIKNLFVPNKAQVNKRILPDIALLRRVILLIIGLAYIFFGFIAQPFLSIYSWIMLLSPIPIALVFLYLMPKLTLEGAQLLLELKGFKLYMETAEKYRERFNEKENIFEKFLPYAILFGLTGKWIKAMKNIYGEKYMTTYHPIWFYGPNIANFNIDTFTSSLNSVTSTMASSLSSTPSSSGSGGGGFSGGGGGGGGGGGW